MKCTTRWARQTFNNQVKCEDFIRRKIRQDGFSSFRRGGTPIPLPPAVGARFWPLGEGRQVTSPFGPRSGGFHTGVDFGRAGGSADMPVYASQGGNIIMAGAAQGYGGPDPAGWLVIDHLNADGVGCTEYGHIVREVAVGQRVSRRAAHRPHQPQLGHEWWCQPASAFRGDAGRIQPLEEDGPAAVAGGRA